MILSDDHRAVQDAVRDYVQAEIAPHAAAWDKSRQFPAAALKGLAALGCYGVAVPEAWGGAGLDHLSLALILEEIAAGDGATSTIVSVNNCLVCSILLAWADDAQKARWLVPQLHMQSQHAYLQFGFMVITIVTSVRTHFTICLINILQQAEMQN